MKAPKIYLVVLALLAAACMKAQTFYYRVNNTGVQGTSIYVDLAGPGEALEAGKAQLLATPGADIVFIVEGTNTNYNTGTTISVDFPCTIYGTGYFLDENPQTQADPRTSSIDAIEFITGSEGSRIYGITTDFVNVLADDITVSKCNILRGLTVSADNTTISKNFIQGVNATAIVDLIGAGSATIINNFIYNEGPGSANNLKMDSSSSGVVLYNSFWGARENIFQNVVIEGNYFSASEFSALTSSNISVNANADSSGFLDLSFGGPPHVTVWPDSVYCLAAIPPQTTDGQYQTNLILWDEIINPNPIFDYINELTLFGTFGGSDPYLLSGMPRIPSVYEYSGNGSGTSGGGTNSTVKTKTHK